jgi:hypothetical protein
MYLNNAQIFKILFPFVLGFLLYYFNDRVKNIFDMQLPTFKECSDIDLNKKTSMYLKIKNDIYIDKEIQLKILKREKKTLWIPQNLLFKQTTKKVLL